MNVQQSSKTEIRVPIVFNSTDGTGRAMIDEEAPGEHVALLVTQLQDEARAAGVVPDQAYLENALGNLLSFYEEAQEAWERRADGSKGQVVEAELPSGSVVVMGNRDMLMRITQTAPAFTQSAPEMRM